MNRGVLILPAYYEALSELPDELRLAAFDGIIRCGLCGETPNLPAAIIPMFSLIRPSIDAYPTMGAVLGMKAFSAAVLGGIGILYGSVVGGIAVGIAESIAAGYFGATYKDAFAFIILIIVLVIKPTGLFGKKSISKV